MREPRHTAPAQAIPSRASTGLEIREALSAGAITECRKLFMEYQQQLGVSLCFQGFEAELAALPGEYAPPHGRLLIAYFEGDAVGCVALRPLGNGNAEMKRLYVRLQYRGKQWGRQLAERAIAEAHSMSYRKLRLDTLPEMRSAQRLYAELGFGEIARYNDNPISGARFLELLLT
ncbi:MAG TPA: GNAT family N-acetyltransferase [Usitatibacter sp.]|nr:GNAT family N-acetyltransferase [Usitatibacter sp.]